MNKIYLIVIITLIILFSTCTVSQNTGLIVLTNLSENDVSNIKIGGTLITCYISRGAKIDYWYYKPLTGQLTGVGIVKNVYYYNLGDNQGTLSSNEDNLEFLVNYEYKIDIIQKDNKSYFFLHGGIQPGDDYDNDERENPFE